MPITGKFVADFSDFDKGVQGAIPKLESFQSAAEKAGGRLMDLGQKSQDAGPRVLGLADSMRTFDGALASMGIHIGPEIKALGELGNVSGKSALGLGAVATAGLALAVGMGAWKIGRMAMEFLELDGAVQKAWERLLGFQSGAAEAGAKADVLARASKTAGHEITDMATAVKINADAAADMGLKMGRSRDAVHDTMVAVSGWQREIREVRKNGDFEQLSADMASQDFTLQALSKKYGIHVEALQYLSRQTKAAADVQQQANDARKKAAGEVAAAEKEAIAFTALRWKQQLELDVKITDSTAKQTAAYLKLRNEGTMAELAAQTELNKVWGLDASGAIAHQITAIETLEGKLHELQILQAQGQDITKRAALAQQEYGDALMKEALADDAARNARAAGNTELGKVPPVANAAGSSINDLADTFNKAAGVIVGGLTTVASIPRNMRPGESPIETQAEFVARTIRSGIPHMAAGGPVMQDGPIYAHAGEYVIPKGGGGGTTINYYGNVLATKAELARAIKDALAESHMSGGGRMPA